MKRFTLGLLLSLVSVSAFADTADFKTLANEQETMKLCYDFANSVNKNFPNAEKSIDVVRPYSVLPKIEMDNLQYQNTGKHNVYADRFGDSLEVIHIDTHKFAKDHYMTHRFLLKRTKHALYASCSFYKPNDRWILSSFVWKDNPFIFSE